MPRIQKDLRTGIGQIEFELDEAEYAAMGRVTAHWAYLEHGVYAVTAAIADAVGGDLPGDALSLSFKRRMKALRLLVEECAPPGERERMIRLIDRIANAQQDRHKVTHAMWEWDNADPEKISASSFRPGFEFEKLFDAARLHLLADEIAQISFALEYPEGWDAAFVAMIAETEDADGNVAFFGMSRQLRRELSSRKAQAQDASDPTALEAGTAVQFPKD